MKKLLQSIHKKTVKRLTLAMAAVSTMAVLALTVGATSPSPTLDFSGATDAIAPAIVGLVNDLLPVGIAILVPILGLKLIPRVIYMFL
jgi:hypothetical protein